MSNHSNFIGDNFGIYEYFIVDGSSSGTELGLMRFDLSAIPGGATVTSAQLSFYTEPGGGSGTPVELYEVLEAWDEGTGYATPGACNWTARISSQSWATPGVGSGSRGTTSRGSVTPSSGDSEFTTAVNTSVVQSWVGAPSSNHGLALVMASGPSVVITSAQGPPSKRPLFTVTYQLP